MAQICEMTISVSLDYKNARSLVSSINLLKIIHKFPQYTDYLLGIDSSNLPNQITF
jgi:hypothetical protein